MLACTSPASSTPPTSPRAFQSLVATHSSTWAGSGPSHASTSRARPGNADVKLMIQVGGSWLLPAAAGTVSFDKYTPNAPFPELITEKALLSNVASVSAVEGAPSQPTCRCAWGTAACHSSSTAERYVKAASTCRTSASNWRLRCARAEPEGGVCTLDLIAHSDAFGSIVADQARVGFRILANALDGLSLAQRSVRITAVDCFIPAAHPV